MMVYREELLVPGGQDIWVYVGWVVEYPVRPEIIIMHAPS